MISTSQAWKDNQQAQLRSESDVRITFYEINNYKIVSTLGSVNKSNISSFSFRESGSIMGMSLYDVDIHFSLLKNSGTTIDFPSSSFIQIEFGYYLNGAWEYISRGYFELVEKTNKANSFTIDYVAKHINYSFLGQPYKLGMYFPYGNKNSMQQIFEHTIKLLLNNYQSTNTSFAKGDLLVDGITNWYSYSGGGSSTYRYSYDIPEMSYLELIQTGTQEIGASYRILGKINGSNEYFTNIKLYDFFTAIDFSSVDFVFTKNDINFLSFPELISNPKYKSIAFYNMAPDYGGTSYTQSITSSGGIKYYQSGSRSIESSPDPSYPVNAGKFCYSGGIIGVYSSQTFSLCAVNLLCVEMLYNIQTLNSSYVDELKYSNPFTNSYNISDHAIDFGIQTIEKWVNSDSVDFSLRIDPSIELYDKVRYTDNSNVVHDSIVEKVDIRYNGAFLGNIIVRRNDNLLPPVKKYSNDIYFDNDSDKEYGLYIQNNNNFSVQAKIVNEDESTTYGTFTIPANSYISIDNYDDENMPQTLVDAIDDYWWNRLSKSICVYFQNGNDKSSMTTFIERNGIATLTQMPRNAKSCFTNTGGSSWVLEIEDQPNNFACSVQIQIDDWDTDWLRGYIQPLANGYFSSDDDDRYMLNEFVQQYNNHELEQNVSYNLWDADGGIDCTPVVILEPNMEYQTPTATITYNSSSDWQIVVSNPYHKDCDLLFYFNNGIDNYDTIPSESSITLNQSNASDLTPYLESYYDNHSLNNDIGFILQSETGATPSSKANVVCKNTIRTLKDFPPFSLYLGSGGTIYFSGTNPNNVALTMCYEYQSVEYHTSIVFQAQEVVNAIYPKKYSDDTLATIYQLRQQHQLADDVSFYGKDANGNKTNVFYTIIHNNS